MNPGTSAILATRAGAMPVEVVATFQREDGAQMVEVRGTNGRLYTAHASNVHPASESYSRALQHRAAALVAAGYVVYLQWPGTFRVCQPSRHTAAGGWLITRTPAGWRCNCPVGVSRGECKHSIGLPALLLAKAEAARAAGKPRHAETYQLLALETGHVPPRPTIEPVQRARILAEREELFP